MASEDGVNFSCVPYLSLKLEVKYWKAEVFVTVKTSI